MDLAGQDGRAEYPYPNLQTRHRLPAGSGAKNTFNTNAYKLAVSWRQSRTSVSGLPYNRAVQGFPNVIELYAPSGLALTGTNDQCVGATTNVHAGSACIDTKGRDCGQYGKVWGNTTNRGY